MRTDIIAVTNTGDHMQTVLREAEKTAEYKGLSEQSSMQLRLLTEEMMGLMRSITGEKKGEFWIEDQDGVFQLHLKVETVMDGQRRKQLIAVSSEGKNEAAQGLMGKIRAFFEPSGDTPTFAGLFMPGSSPQMYGSLTWSMEEYRENVAQMRKDGREGAEEAWDELEKSVVAHVADEVKVSIRGTNVEITIYKKLA